MTSTRAARQCRVGPDSRTPASEIAEHVKKQGVQLLSCTPFAVSSVLRDIQHIGQRGILKIGVCVIEEQHVRDLLAGDDGLDVVIIIPRIDENDVVVIGIDARCTARS